MIWRWRVEAAAVTATAGLTGWMVDGSGLPFAWLMPAGVVLACIGTPVIRQGIGDRVRALVIRHRFQGLCLDTAMRTRKGRLPLVLTTTVVPGGALLLLWLRRGLTAELVADYLPEIRSACFAEHVTMTPHHLGPHLIMLEISR